MRQGLNEKRRPHTRLAIRKYNSFQERRELMPQRVAIVQRDIPNYRVAFLNLLSEKLEYKGIELTVFAGKAHRREGFVDALDDLRCGVRVKNFDLGAKIYWQPI